MIKDLKAEIRKISAVGKTAFDLSLFVGDAAREASPGRFVSVGCGQARLLRRPLSICDASSDGLIRLVFEVRGEGTRWLSERRAGETLDVLGPLGNGFDLKASYGLPALLIAGGIGAPPILFAAKRFDGESDIVAGFRDRDAVILEEDMRKAAGTVTICTDDGSYGECGLVTVRAERLLKEKKYGIIYACGPAPMLKAVAKLSESHRVPCQVSLEERMGCAVGACLVCACAVRGEDGIEYKHVCKDGPVFNAGEVVF